MSDELVERLRAYNDESFVETLCGEAAARIEALTAERAQIDAAVKAERERCAKVAAGAAWWAAGDIAALIRKGETP